jgi:hypothetical protein
MIASSTIPLELSDDYSTPYDSPDRRKLKQYSAMICIVDDENKKLRLVQSKENLNLLFSEKNLLPQNMIPFHMLRDWKKLLTRFTSSNIWNPQEFENSGIYHVYSRYMNIWFIFLG